MRLNERQAYIKKLEKWMYDCAKWENFADIDGNVAEVKKWNDEYQRCAIELQELTR